MSEIELNEKYKSEFDDAAATVYRRAERLNRWRLEHPKPSKDKVRELVDLYNSLGEARQELKSAIKGYYGINF